MPILGHPIFERPEIVRPRFSDSPDFSERFKFPASRHHFEILKFRIPEILPSPKRKGKTSLREFPIFTITPKI